MKNNSPRPDDCLFPHMHTGKKNRPGADENPVFNGDAAAKNCSGAYEDSKPYTAVMDDTCPR